MHVFTLQELARFKDTGPSVQVIARSGHARQVLFSLRAGQGLREHTTSSQIAVQVMSGQFSFEAQEVRCLLAAGQLLLLEAGVPHSLEADEDTVMLLTMTPEPQHHSLEAELFDRIEPMVDFD